MYQIIKNKESLIKWLEDKENVTQKILNRKDIRNHLLTVMEVLDQNYGSNRDWEKDLGGYLIIFYGESNDIEQQAKDYLQRYQIKEDEYEFEDVYKFGIGGKKVVFRLYLCSSDYAIQVGIIYK